MQQPALVTRDVRLSPITLVVALPSQPCTGSLGFTGPMPPYVHEESCANVYSRNQGQLVSCGYIFMDGGEDLTITAQNSVQVRACCCSLSVTFHSAGLVLSQYNTESSSVAPVIVPGIVPGHGQVIVCCFSLSWACTLGSPCRAFSAGKGAVSTPPAPTTTTKLCLNLGACCCLLPFAGLVCVRSVTSRRRWHHHQHCAGECWRCCWQTLDHGHQCHWPAQAAGRQAADCCDG